MPQILFPSFYGGRNKPQGDIKTRVRSWPFSFDAKSRLFQLYPHCACICVFLNIPSWFPNASQLLCLSLCPSPEYSTQQLGSSGQSRSHFWPLTCSAHASFGNINAELINGNGAWITAVLFQAIRPLPPGPSPAPQQGPASVPCPRSCFQKSLTQLLMCHPVPCLVADA